MDNENKKVSGHQLRQGRQTGACIQLIAEIIVGISHCGVIWL